MKITKAFRTSFVNAILRDIKTGLDNELIAKLTQAEALKALPPEILDCWNIQALRPHVAVRIVNFDRYYRTDFIPLNSFDSRYLSAGNVVVPSDGTFVPSTKLCDKVTAMLKEQGDRLTAKASMEKRLTAMAATCNKREALVAMFPDLLKYIPPADSVAVAYPVPAIIMKDFMHELKQMGIPAKKEAVPA